MRTTQYILATLKEKPSSAETISHQLMLRAGMIRQLASGLYTWLPTGLRVMQKVKALVRAEMQRIGFFEISMPVVQPASLWQESGRWEQYGSELLKLADRNHRSFVIGPTHEEVITDFIRNEITSYKQLPIKLFQIQTKFRDEVRPRFGVIRSREFLMKDGYSFHETQESLQETYSVMYRAYSNILKKMDLNFCIVEADTGSIGGYISHEFQVLAPSGDNVIAYSTESTYAANLEIAEALPPKDVRQPGIQKKTQFSTQNITTIQDLSKNLHIPIKKIVQTLVVKAKTDSSNGLVALLVRGDHVLNKIKAEKIDIIASPLHFMSDQEIRQYYQTGLESLGPIGLNIPIIADRSVAAMSDFIIGANIDGQYFRGINWGRDLPLPRIEDIRNVVEGDVSSDGKGTLLIKRGIEVGHIFQLGTKYSKALKAIVQTSSGCSKIIRMGCYGIGISRIIAAAIEQNHDERGIIWSSVLAPFQVAILPINIKQSSHVRCSAENLYLRLLAEGIDVILDDRTERLGVMFSDMELIGVPHILVISDHNLKNKEIEYKSRALNQKRIFKISEIIFYLKSELHGSIFNFNS
ncbi:proline--tRNA ligase [Candidatus Erwinia haradaeae]|uniref:Proline--tRNA ligase n=1 Tax=Candidatus Erwinia haradaeae TaxID=1922217 RepID=A0A451DGQ6_9GAMM|nr:proline--tRNA ligase [Candidatus Erwinia haradaeae]VFP85831.1 Proline--tRNA ligase [Candidatus Erwinia haradaeae]